MRYPWRVLALVQLTFWLAAAAIAQAPPGVEENAPPAAVQEKPKFNVLEQFGQGGPFGGTDDFGPKILLSAKFEIESGKQVGRLLVTADPAPGWHFYSITQPKNGPMPSVLKLEPSDQFKLTGPFVADVAPEIHPAKEFPVPSEEHATPVTWTAPLELTAGVKPDKLEIAIRYSGQACKESCIPVNEKLVAKFEGEYVLPKATGEFIAKSKHVTWNGQLESATATPGSKVKLLLTATPVEPYHIYAYRAAPKGAKEIGPSPTLIALRNLPGGWKQGLATTTAKVVTKKEGEAETTYHDGPVMWTVEIDIPKDSQVGKYELEGAIGFQTCEEQGSCDLPVAATFRVPLTVTDKPTPGGSEMLSFASADYSDAEKLAAASAHLFATITPVEPFTARSLGLAIAFALLGGLILNVMPCVLPVIPLKLLSFVEQAGHNSGKLIGYNVSYALGSIAVFMTLAIVGIAFGLRWGEQFGFMQFQVVVTLFMFAMALSLLGVWEIPVPDFGSGEGIRQPGSETMVGSFWKGIMTTIYATPCSGPFFGTAMAATISFPPYATLLVFLAAGIGFASPYLVLGVLMAAFPKTARLLPKPGVWMEYVKQALGFVLLLVIVFYFLQLIEVKYWIPTLFAAIGVGFACWLVGKVPVYAELRTRAFAWAGAVASIALVASLSFNYLAPASEKDKLLPWQDYSEQALTEAKAQGKTVMIDFTASWCPNCHFNYRTAINTLAVQEVVKKNDVVTLIADWSDRGSAIGQKLTEYKSNSIPLLVVLPADGGEPIIMRDIVIQSQVVSALEKAGPSRVASKDDSSKQGAVALQK